MLTGATWTDERKQNNVFGEFYAGNTDLSGHHLQ